MNTIGEEVENVFSTEISRITNGQGLPTMSISVECIGCKYANCCWVPVGVRYDDCKKLMASDELTEPSEVSFL